MFDRILIAVDGSDYSKRAAKFGLKLARPYNGEVNVLHSIEDTFSTGDASEGDQSHPSQADEILEEISEMAADIGVTAETRVVERQPSEAIINQASESSTDLIVMGRQGRTGVGERMLGSVTDRVLRNTDVPVLIVPDGDPVSTDGVTYAHILAPTDGSEAAERAAPYSADIAQHHGATLHLLHVIDLRFEGIFSGGGASDDFLERLEEQGHNSIDQFAERVGQTDVDTDTAGDTDLRKTVVRGTQHEVIAEYVAENEIDLIVMASQGESGLTGQLLGSVTDRVIRIVDSPVLVVPVV